MKSKSLLLLLLAVLFLSGCVRAHQELWIHPDGSATMVQEVAVADQLANSEGFSPPFDNYNTADPTIRNLKRGEFTRNDYTHYFAEFEIVDLARFVKTSAQSKSMTTMQLQTLGNGHWQLTQTLPAPTTVDDPETAELLLSGHNFTVAVHTPYVWRTNGATTSGDNGNTKVAWEYPMEDVVISGVEDVLSLEYSLAKPKAASTRGYVYLRNTCGSPIRVALSYKNKSGEWEYKYWWRFDAYESDFLAVEGTRISSDNSYFYLYADATDGSDWLWNGDKRLDFGDMILETREMKLEKDRDGDWSLVLSCD